MEVYKIEPNIPYGSNTYVLVSEGEGVVIDPSCDFEYAAKKIDLDAEIKYIILTHGHFDHMLAIDDWVKRTNAVVFVGEKDAPYLSDSNLNCYKLFFNMNKGYKGNYVTVREGDIISFGAENLYVTETPGHTPGSVTLKASGYAFVGDVIFSAYSIGRTDLPGGDYPLLGKSIEKILAFDLKTVIYPGHGEGTTIYKIINEKR